jgi:beta-glucosidase
MSNQTNLPYKQPQLPVTQRVRDLLGRMTLDEKLAQLSAAWFLEIADGELFSESTSLSVSKAQARIGNGIGQITGLASRSSFKPKQVAQATNAVQTFLTQNTRLGIPAIFHDECCCGFMAREATTFPQMIGLASTWDPDLAEAMSSVFRKQMRSVGTRQGLAPVLDICRDPRWGRVEETFGEDPYLASCMGTAYIRGLQGSDLSQGVIATGKHFAGHGISEGGLNWAPVHVGQREFREVFLHTFEAAVRVAKLASIMNAYHEIDGIPCAASHLLLTDILRGEWGFDGIVTADYNAVVMLADYHHVAADKGHAARMALEAGLDIELPGTDCYGEPLKKDIDSGKIELSFIDRAVERILTLKFRLGLFETPFVDPEQAPENYNQPDQLALARTIAQKSIVLLKNEDSLLPLRSDLKSIAVIGPNADTIRHMVGDYSYGSFTSLLEGGDLSPEKSHFPERFPSSMISILDAIKSRVSSSTKIIYARGCGITDPSKDGFSEAILAARASEVAILVMGGKSGLNKDCTCGELRDRAQLGLLGVQEELVQEIVDTGTPVVMVLVDGRPAAIPVLAECIPALLEAWLPGQEGGPAIADVLIGRINPGGKLPITTPRSPNQLPMFYGRKPSGGRSYNFEDYVDYSAKPLYPFGHGLSYTHFEYGDLKISPEQVQPSEEVTIQCTIKNVGEVVGDEVVQLYIHDSVSSITRPVKELKGFRRITLQPDESCNVYFTIPVAQLGFYDLKMRYVVEAGTIEVMVGSSSDDIRLVGKFVISGDGCYVVDKVFFSKSENGEIL